MSNAGLRPQPNLGPLTLNVGHEPKGFGGPRGNVGSSNHGGSLLAMAIPTDGSSIITSNGSHKTYRKGDFDVEKRWLMILVNAFPG